MPRLAVPRAHGRAGDARQLDDHRRSGAGCCCWPPRSSRPRSAPPAFRCRACRPRLGLRRQRRSRRIAARDQLVLWSVRLPRIAMATIIGALLAVERRDHAGPVPQSAGRSGAGRRFERRRARGGRHHCDRRPAARAGKIVAAVRVAAGRGVSSARWSTTLMLLSHRHAREPHLDCDLPARRHRHRARWPMPASACWCSSPTTGSCAT